MDWDNRRWPNFSPEEFRCKGSGRMEMNVDFLDRLQALRTAFGKPMIITSGYRSPEHNKAVSSTGSDGPHTTGRAVDVAVSGADAVKLVGLAIQMGFTGIGVKQKGPHAGRFIHLDDLTAGPRPGMWSY